eukprot:6482694-Amphidinium_carterae.1
MLLKSGGLGNLAWKYLNEKYIAVPFRRKALDACIGSFVRGDSPMCILDLLYLVRILQGVLVEHGLSSRETRESKHHNAQWKLFCSCMPFNGTTERVKSTQEYRSTSRTVEQPDKHGQSRLATKMSLHSWNLLHAAHVQMSDHTLSVHEAALVPESGKASGLNHPGGHQRSEQSAFCSQ